MSFNVRCPQCQKRYAADAKLVGKRIRCRQCGMVFPVVAQEDEPEAAVKKLKPAAVAAGGGSVAGGTVSDGSVAGGSVNGTSLAHDNLTDEDPISAATKAAPSEPVFTNTETAHDLFVRGSRPQPFPASRMLERWVPRALPAVLAVWAVYESFNDDHTGTIWAPIVRVLIVTAIYLGVVVPLTLRGTYLGLKIGRYAAPPKPYWRTAVTFCLPVTLGFVLWMVSGSGFSFVAGCLVGAALAFIVFWLLFRQDWASAGVSYSISGGTFVATALLGMLLMVGVNFALNQIMIAAHKAGTYAHSPLGDGLAWTAPPAKTLPAKSPVPKVDSVAQNSNDSTQTPDPPAADPKAHAESTANPPDQPIVAPQPPIPSRTTVGSQQQESPVVTPPPTHGEGLFHPENPPGADTLVGRIKAAQRPWVSEVSAAEEITDDRFLLQPLPSRYVGLVRHRATGGMEIECCSANPFSRVGALPVIDDPIDGATGMGRYAISLDGKNLIRLADFPSRQIEVQSFDQPGEMSKVPLTVALAPFTEHSPIPDRSFSPQLLAALPNHQVLIRWTRGKSDIEILEVWDYQQKQNKLRRLARPSEGQHTVGNFAVSPDGKWFASTAPDAAHTCMTMWLYSLTSAKQPVVFPIPEMDAQRWQIEPTGIAFSPDSKKVAVLFEHDAEGFLVGWDVEAKQRIKDTVCPLPTARALVQMGGGRRSLDWLTDDVWLVHGTTLLQAGTGAVIGSLTDDVITGQQLADDHTFYLTYRDSGSTRLAAVSFDPNKLPVVPVDKKRIIP